MISDTWPPFQSILSTPPEISVVSDNPAPSGVLWYYTLVLILIAPPLAQKGQGNLLLPRRMPWYESGKLAQHHH